MKKVAIITGGAQGIGRGICRHLHIKNYQVVCFDNDNEAGTELVQLLPGTFFIKTDVSRESDVKSSIDAVLQKFGSIHCLVNNAGIGIFKPILELSLEEWMHVINVNLTSIFLTAKYARKALVKSKGAIVNISSTRAFMSEPNTESYSASKGGVIALSHALALSLGPDVRVNCISPGWIEVSDFQKVANYKVPKHTEIDKTQHPVGRVGTPEDIAQMVYFLLQPENGFITGQNFIVDGGMTKKMIYV